MQSKSEIFNIRADQMARKYCITNGHDNINSFQALAYVSHSELLVYCQRNPTALLYTELLEDTVRVNWPVSKNIQIKTSTRDRTFSTSCSISRCMASNKHGPFSPTILLGVFLDGIKKLIHQTGLRINVKFALGARDDQLCSTAAQNWKESDKKNREISRRLLLKGICSWILMVAFS